MKGDSMKEYYEKDLDYRPSASRMRRILALAGDNLSGKKILDIGCGAGELGAEFKKEGAHVTGIELSERAGALARAVLDEVRVANIEETWPVFSTKFNIIIATEVIEHLFNPQALLGQVQNVLAPHGVFIVTTPNFLVWSNRIKMLFGKFQYTESGFLDRGHIHFYTRPTLLNDLHEAGLSIVAENHIIHPKIPAWLGKLFPNLFSYQLIVKAHSSHGR